VICGRDNCNEDPRRVRNGQKDIKESPWLGFPGFSILKYSSENSRVVDECAADAESVSEMHRGHSCQRVHVFPAHPHALSVVMSHTVEKAIFLGKQSWWHARVEDEYYESEEVRERHGSSHNRKSIERRSCVIVPCDEAVDMSVTLKKGLLVDQEERH